MKIAKHCGKHSRLLRTMPMLGGLLWLAIVAFWLCLFRADYNLIQVDTQSYMLAPIFITFGVLAIVILVPGIILTVSAGYLFGLVKGLIYVLIATTLGSTLAFVLGRKVFKHRLIGYLDDHHPLLFKLNNGLQHKGGLVVFLTRLIPFFPFKLSNYYFGAADYNVRGFVVGTALGIIPISSLNVTLGVAMAQYGDSPIAHDVTQPWWLISGGAAALAALIGIVSYQARRSLNALRQKNQSSAIPPEQGNA